jgi:hypothetical protein
VRRRTRSLACKVKKARKQVTTGSAASSGVSCAMVLTVYSVLSSKTGFVVSVASVKRQLHRQLDASIGASGPHGFTVRFQVARLAHQKRPPHPAPNVRDDRDTPLFSGTGWREVIKMICPSG